MATTRWTPTALDRADQWQLTLSGTWTAGDTIVLAIPSASTGPSITLTVGSTLTNTQIASEIVTAWNDASTALGTGYSVTERGPNIPQFAEYTASSASGVVTFTANTKGVPGTIAATRTTASSGAVSISNTTAATGKNFWSDALNWSGGAVPTTGDTVYFDASDVSALYGLAQSGVTLAALYISQSYTGTIGLPEVNESGGYHEYRSQYLAIGATILKVGDGDGTGSGRLKITTGTVQTALTVLNSGSPLEANLPAVIWKGTHASGALVQTGGSVGVAVFGGETATLATVALSGGSLTTGTGTTLSGALTVTGGQWALNSAVGGSATVSGGLVAAGGTGAVAQLTVRGAGQFVYNTSGALNGNTVLESSGVLDMGTAPTSVSVANAITLKGPACQFLDPTGRTGSVSFTLTGGATTAQLSLKPNASIAVS